MTTAEARKIFGLVRLTNSAELKTKHRELVLKHHPDKGGDASYFSKIQEAYELLSKEIMKGSNLSNSDKTKKKESFTKPADNVTDLFNQERTNRKKRALDPSDVELTIEVSVEELNEGFEQRVNYMRRKACENCAGNGCYICEGAIKLENLSAGVYIHSTLMNNKFEIVYKGLGDITYEAADLILKLKIVGSKFKLETSPTESLPIVTSEIYLDSTDQTEVKIKTLNGTKIVSLPEKQISTIKLKGQGLKFNTKKGVEYGNHYVHVKYK